MIRSRRMGSRLTAYSSSQLASAISATRSPSRTSTTSSWAGDDSGHRGFSKPSSTGSGQTRQRATEQGLLPSATRPQPPQVPWLNPGTGDLEAGRHQGVNDEDEEEDAMATEKQKQAARRNLTKARAAQSAAPKASGCHGAPRA